MASSVSHKDTSRSGVGVTAHGVSALRHYETTRGVDALIRDPFAELLSGEIGSAWVESLEPCKKAGMIDGLAVRTRRIDDDIAAVVNVEGGVQVVVLGAGLDSRPWRLGEFIKRSTNWFEVDFPEIFDYKLPIVSVGSTGSIRHVRVDADLSTPTWINKLIESGYEVSRPSVWLLEGLTGYLTEQEASLLFTTIRQHICINSQIIATFLTPVTGVHISLHRFKPDNPLAFIEQLGFEGKQEDFIAIGSSYNRELSPSIWAGYFLVTAKPS